MPLYPQKPTSDGFAPRLALFYAALFLALGIQLPFLPLWLEAKGLDARAIGIVLALPMVVRIVAVPPVTRIADRRSAARGALVVAALATFVGYSALGLSEGYLAIIAIFALASAVQTPLMPLTDAYAMRGLTQRGQAYGPVRLWGSVAFILGSFGAGIVLDTLAPRNLIWLLVAGLAATAGAAALLAPLNPAAARPSTAAPSATMLLRDRAFVLVIVAASLVQASHAVYNGFSTLAWRAAGLDGTIIGGLWAIGVLAEIVLFALSGRLPAVIGPSVLLIIGAAGAVVRWLAMAFDPPTEMLPVLQCLHGLSFGASHLGALAFVARAVPAALAATAQGYLSIVLGLVMAAAMGLSGLLYAAYGGLAYAAMAVAALASLACALAAHRLSSQGTN